MSQLEDSADTLRIAPGPSFNAALQEYDKEGGCQDTPGEGVVLPARLWCSCNSAFGNMVMQKLIRTPSMSKQEYDDEGGYRETPGEGAVEPARLRYSYYTAGSGGVGPTILETSMLLAGEEVVAFRDGQKASF